MSVGFDEMDAQMGQSLDEAEGHLMDAMRLLSDATVRVRKIRLIANNNVLAAGNLHSTLVIAHIAQVDLKKFIECFEDLED